MELRWDAINIIEHAAEHIMDGVCSRDEVWSDDAQAATDILARAAKQMRKALARARK